MSLNQPHTCILFNIKHKRRKRRHRSCSSFTSGFFEQAKIWTVIRVIKTFLYNFCIFGGLWLIYPKIHPSIHPLIQECTAYGPRADAARVSRVCGPHDLPQFNFFKLAHLMFEAYIFQNVWQLLMVLFQFIPKSGIFSDFQLLGTPEDWSISIFHIKVHHFHFFSWNK